MGKMSCQCAKFSSLENLMHSNSYEGSGGAMREYFGHFYKKSKSECSIRETDSVSVSCTTIISL